MSSHLLILGERDAIAWVVSQQRMAFTADRAARAATAVSLGDELFLYATRGAFHNPRLDRGRVFGRAIASTPVEVLRKPMLLAGKTFTHGFAFDLDSLTAPRVGIDLADLVPKLATFRNKTGWASTLRRPLVTLVSEDAKLIRRLLRKETATPSEWISRYVAESRTPIPKR